MVNFCTFSKISLELIFLKLKKIFIFVILIISPLISYVTWLLGKTFSFTVNFSPPKLNPLKLEFVYLHLMYVIGPSNSICVQNFNFSRIIVSEIVCCSRKKDNHKSDPKSHKGFVFYSRVWNPKKEHWIY